MNEPLTTLLDQVLTVDDLGLELAPLVEVLSVLGLEVLQMLDQTELLLVDDCLASLAYEFAFAQSNMLINDEWITCY